MTLIVPAFPPERLAANPFACTGDLYAEAGWLGAIPLPALQKHPPPTGWTGRNAPYPDQTQRRQWRKADRYRNANIGLHLGDTPEGQYEVMGIDVDTAKGKLGPEQLAGLEAQHGPLPPTYVSSARPLPSGIRFYRVRRGLRYRGKAASAIDIIQRAHRYAVVWPSWNPDAASQYRWLSPDGTVLDGIPCVDDLPLLPEAWLEFLTGGQTDTDVLSDSDSTPSELAEWADSTFRGADGDASALCVVMDAAVDYWRQKIADEESSHDKITGADYHLLALASEGHGPWRVARHLVAEAYMNDPNTRRKRSVDELRGEVGRSGVGALRKYKAAIESGERTVAARCGCPIPGDDDHAAMVAALEMGADWKPQRSITTESDSDESPSWAAVDVGAALAGVTAPPPTVLTRADGACLFYRGKVHSVHGESESGKSWLVQCAAAECLAAGESVLYIDFEDDAGPVAQRLVRLGVQPAILANPEMFVYVRPESPPTDGAEREAFRRLLSGTYALAVVDGVTDSMGLFGLSGKDADDVARWHRALPKAIARRTNAAVVCVDHVAKDSQTRGRFALGSQHKMAGLSGAAYVVEMEQPFAVGQAGTASVRVGKDRPGQVRKLGGRWRKSDRTQHIATFRLDSADPERTVWALDVPEDAGQSTQVDASSSVGGKRTFRPTWFMEQVSRYWEQSDDPAERTTNKTVAAMCERRKAEDKPTQRDRWRDAVRILVEEGFARAEEGARGSSIHSVVSPYRADEDPLSDSYSGVSDDVIRRFPINLKKAAAGGES